jgi:hypothetical protein
MGNGKHQVTQIDESAKKLNDSSVEPYIQELQMNLEQIEKGAMITLC